MYNIYISRTYTPFKHTFHLTITTTLPQKKQITPNQNKQESSIIWAHWLIRTYTLGSLDTKRVALVARLDALLSQLSDDPESSLPRLIEESGIAHLNIFVSPSLAAEASGVCRALAKAGHTLGLETAAGT